MILKELVPPLELCKKIPAGEFADCALVWRVPNCSFPQEDEFFEIHERDKCESWMKDKQIPAPTLKEILRATQPGDVGVFCSHQGDGDWSVGDSEHDLYVKNGFNSKSPEELSLKWWFEQKGINT